MSPFSKNRILALLFTALIIAPMLFLVPVTPRSGVAVVLAATLVPEDSPTKANCNSDNWSIKGCIIHISYTLLVGVPNWILFLVGIVFDVLLAFSLSSHIINNQSFVDTGWVIMRDLSNTFFIFVLLWIAISAILQLAGGQTKRLLATLVMVALFMNFSLYITKFVIDVGNIFALEFYVNMSAGPMTWVNFGADDIVPLSISQGIINALNVTRILAPSIVDGALGLTFAIFTFFLVGIMLLIFSFVLLTAGFLFLARVAAFWLLMILSPLAFFSMVLPFTRGKVWNPWFSQLINQSFLAPIFLFFLYLTLMLANTMTEAPIFQQGTKSGDPAVDLVVLLLLTFLNFFALIIVLLFGLKTAKGMSGELGASMLKLGGVATGAAVGGAAWAGRNTLGRAARYADDKLGKDLDNSRAGRFVRSGLTGLSSSSFDARATKVAQMAQSTVGGINLGAPGGPRGGHAGAVAEKQKDVGEHTKKLLAKDPKAAASYLASHEKFDPLGDRDTTAVMASLSSAQRAELIANATGKDQDRLKSINVSLGAGFTDKQKKAEAKGVKEYAKAASKERREEGQEARVAAMREIKTKYANAANDAQKSAAKKESEDILKQMKGEEIADLDGDLLSHDIVAHHLSDKDLEYIERKSNLTKEHQEALYANIKASGRDEAKAYLNLSFAQKRKNASKNRKWEAEDAEEALRRELREADAKKEAETDTARRAKAEWDRVGENKTATVDGKPIE